MAGKTSMAGMLFHAMLWVKNKRSVRHALSAAAVACLIRYLTETFAGHKGIFAFETTTLTLCVFVQAMVLSGVLQDYKEAERYPATLAGQLEGMLFAMQVVIENDKTARSESRDKILRGVLEIVDAHLQMCINAHSKSALPLYYACIKDATMKLVVILRGHGLSRESGDLASDVSKVRAGAARLAVMAQTTFLPSAYMLYDGMVVAVLIVLQIATFASQRAQYTNVFLFTAVFTYMSLLIRDADHPMEYSHFMTVPRLCAAHGGLLLPEEAASLFSHHGHAPSAEDIGDEVALFPLIQVRDRVVEEILAPQPVVKAESLPGSKAEEDGPAAALTTPGLEEPLPVHVPAGLAATFISVQPARPLASVDNRRGSVQ